MGEVIDLSIGSVLIGPNEDIKKYAAASLLHEWGGYLQPQGSETFREKIAVHFPHGYKSITKENILVTPGATMGINLVFRLYQGQTILLPDPGFPLYKEIAELYNINVITYRVGGKHDWNVTFYDIKIAIKKKEVKLIVLNNPNNPTGFVHSEEQIQSICALCSNYKVSCLSDEVYRDFHFQSDHIPSPVSYIPNQTFLIYSLSKSYAMTGLRIGFLISPNKEIASELSLIQWRHMMSVSWHSQQVAAYAIEKQKTYPSLVNKVVKSNAKYMERLLKTENIDYYQPAGGIFYCIDTRKFDMDSESFCQKLFEQNHVLLTPCQAFGTTGKYISRVNIATDPKVLQKAMERLVSFISKLKEVEN